MIPETPRWRETPNYSYVNELEAPDQAWEWLRRNHAYQDDYANFSEGGTDPAQSAMSARQRWGLRHFCPA